MTGAPPTATTPAALAIDPGNVPAELRARSQWVAWRWEPKKDEPGAWTKVPVNPHTGTRASSTDPRTWSDFDTALAYADRHGLPGVGYVFTAGDPFTGVDLDTCRDPLTERLEPWAAEIVRDLNSYTELSPSETGVHCIVRATKPGDSSRRGKIEMYDAGRYFTVTGHRLAGTPAAIEDRQAPLDSLYAATFGTNGHMPPTTPPPVAASALTDDEIIEKARSAKYGDKFCRLWAGDTAAYDGDDSAADLALCSMLAFWTQDPGQIGRLFRRSGLYRDKWERTDYRTWTINKALDRAERWEPGATIVTNGHHREEAPALLSAAPKGEVPAESKLRFHSAAEIAAATAAEPVFVARPWVAESAITEIDGKIKSSGKTTLCTYLCRAVLDGRDFMGEPTRRSPVVYLTEQSPATFREALRRADLLDRKDFRVLFWHDTIGTAWPEIILAARAEAHRIGARVLVVDTLGQFSGVRGDAENNAGAALEAMAPLQAAAASDGLAVIILRHDRKGGGDVGDSGRGSSAFAGAVDVVLQLRRAEGQGRPGVRVLNALSRYDETPDTLVIELTEAGYVALGDTEALAAEEARGAVLEAAPRNEEDALREAELFEAAGVKRTIGQGAIREHLEAGRLRRVGEGKKGDPFRYWRPCEHENDAAAPKEGVPAESISESRHEGEKVSAATREAPAEPNRSAAAEEAMHSAGTQTIYAAESNNDRATPAGIAGDDRWTG